MLKIKIHVSKDGKFYFTINSKNGQVIATSETYTRKTSLRRSVASLVSNVELWNFEIIDTTV